MSLKSTLKGDLMFSAKVQRRVLTAVGAATFAVASSASASAVDPMSSLPPLSSLPPAVDPGPIEADHDTYRDTWDGTGFEFFTPRGNYCYISPEHTTVPGDDRQFIMCSFEDGEFNAVGVTAGELAGPRQVNGAILAPRIEGHHLDPGYKLTLGDASCRVEPDESTVCGIGDNSFTI